METVPTRCDSWPTIAEAAVELGVSPSHVCKLAQANTLRSVTLDNRRRLIDPTSIVDYLARVHLPERRERRVQQRPELLDVIPAQPGGDRGQAKGTRYPLRPLVVLLEIEEGERVSTSWLARRLDVSTAAVLRARSEGLTQWMADRWAIRAGHHPGLVWHDDWWHAYEAQERQESMRRHPSYRAIAETGLVAA